MPIINSYPQDIDIQDQDAWIGTDYTTKGTKQYTAEAVANYLNEKGKVSIAGQVSYKFVDTLFAGQGTMALSPNNGSSFSAITGFKIAKADLSGQGIQEYLDYLVGREIIIVDQGDPNSFGHYSIYTYTVDDDNDQYYDLVVTFLGGNGSISVNSFYSLANFTFGGENATKATLTNIGIGNVNPSTYPTLKGLTVSYNNGTATIGLNIQDLPNTAVPTSASDILVPWATEVSGVTYNSKATLQDLIDDTGIVGGPYLPLNGGTLTGDLYVDTKVGVGTNNPDTPLHVVGNVKIETTGSVDNLLLTSTDATLTGAPDISLFADTAAANGDTIGNIQFRGRNGMVPGSTASLTYAAFFSHIIDKDNNQSILALTGHKGNGPGANKTVANFSVIGTNNSGEGAVLINPSSGYTPSSYNLEVNGDFKVVDDAYFDSNVGIGTTSPGYKLEVSGNSLVTGTQFIGDTFTKIQQAGGNLLFSNLSSSGGIEFRTNSTEKMRILANGNVGIGTTSPSDKLHVLGDQEGITIQQSAIGNVFNGIDFVNYTGSSNAYIKLNQSSGEFRVSTDPSYFPTFYASGTEAMRISTAGNVGIGVTNPHTKLTINDSNTAGISQFGIGDVSSYYLAMGHNSSGNTDGFIGTVYNNNSARFDIRMKGTAQSDAKVTVLGSGNVGIGVTNPQDFNSEANNLVIGTGSGAEGMTIYGGSSGSASIYFADGTSGSAQYEGFLQYRHSDRAMRFGTAAGVRMTLNGNGYLGIGTTSPGEKLEVAGDMNLYNPSNTSQINFRNISNSNYIKSNGYSTHFGLRGNLGNGQFIIENNLDTYQDIRIIPATSGWNISTRGVAGANALLTIDTVLNVSNKTNVGIGTTSPSEKLEVNGDININNSGDRVFITDRLNGGFQLGDIDSLVDEAIIQGDGSSIFLKNAGNTTLTTDINNRVGIGTTNPAAKLDIESTTSGVLLPRMTTAQVNAISSPSNGLTVYNTTLNTLCFYNGSSWWKVSAQTM